MNLDKLYNIANIMLKDKFNIINFDKNDFIEIVKKITPNNELNELNCKNILFEIKKRYENQKIDNNTLQERLKKLEFERNNYQLNK